MSETQEDARIQYVRGFPFSKAPFYTKENLEGTLDYVPHDGDIVIVSYPKTGTRWLEYIVLQILSKAEMFPDFNDALLKYVPFMELVGPKVIDQMESYRVYRTHLPFNRMNKNPKAKYLYIYRNPEDQFISYYKFVQKIRPVHVDYNDFLDGYLIGRIEYARYFEHILSFLEHKNDENLLLISYEKLYTDRRNMILKIAKFLAEEYFQNLSNDEKLLDRVIEHTNFDYMQKNLPFEHPFYKKEVAASKKSNDSFFRKGVIGDGKNSLPAEDVKRIRELAQKLMNGTEVLKEWSALWN
ncbi:sulfotransferase 1B1-like isoform X2 [Argiope bruennichi]|uniref:sulfotransferase 1B1-like isoform X2 n=1 Tax=Argiope bruennichi TaxID=94029 RepID=UPI00249405AD|nr:sulfotransferase 1B1-like isoform X2 [Argiope bruennichi]XP_055937279.1 sulfotransferase 1B1-like isoform X2 [Argiope bruennichi]